jgi:hypothetical protein
MRFICGLMCFWLIITAPLVGMTGFAQGAFLCWGDSGHVGIETEVCEPHCDSRFHSSSSDHEGASVHDACEDENICGACIDIPLPSGGAIDRIAAVGRESASKGMMACIPPHAETTVTAGQAPGAYLLCSCGVVSDESIASLRTVVLLI